MHHVTKVKTFPFYISHTNASHSVWNRNMEFCGINSRWKLWIKWKHCTSPANVKPAIQRHLGSHCFVLTRPLILSSRSTWCLLHSTPMVKLGMIKSLFHQIFFCDPERNLGPLLDLWTILVLLRPPHHCLGTQGIAVGPPARLVLYMWT